MTPEQKQRIESELATARARHKVVEGVCESLTDHLAWIDNDVTPETIGFVNGYLRDQRDLALVVDRLERELRKAECC